MIASELLSQELRKARESLAFYNASSTVLSQHTLTFRSALNQMQWESMAANRYRERAYAFIEKSTRLQNEYSRLILALRQYIATINSARLKTLE